jgi:threonine dehydrogenase-like Zn-dependent dehydrogenase
MSNTAATAHAQRSDRSATQHSAASSPEDVGSLVVNTFTHADPVADHLVVAVVGLGYVGLPTAIALRQAGHRIVGIDVSPRRLEAIRGGEVELLSEEREALLHHLDGDGFVLTDQVQALDAADVVLICVPTPIDENLRGLRRRRAPRTAWADACTHLYHLCRHHA